jgi:two-component system NtrC family response regulator
MEHFINKYAGERRNETPVTGATQEVERLLYEYSWPGNVRELENIIERAMIMCPADRIDVPDLPKNFTNQVGRTLHMEGIPVNAKLNETLAMVEKTMIQRALKVTGNIQARAAELLGIGKSGLNQKIKKFKLDIDN